MREQIRQAVQKARKGSYKVQITFKTKVIKYIISVLEMNRKGIIAMNPADALLLNVIAEFDNWGEHSRTFTIVLGYNFDEKIFTDKMCNILEKIEAVD